MSTKAKRNRKKLDPGVLFSGEEMFDDASELDFELDDWSDDDDEFWWADDASETKVSVRRKIERRSDRQRLYSELNDWDRFDRD